MMPFDIILARPAWLYFKHIDQLAAYARKPRHDYQRTIFIRLPICLLSARHYARHARARYHLYLYCLA